MNKYIKTLQVLFFGFLVSLTTFAQDKKEVDITIGTEKNDGSFTQLLLWVIGAAVFILFLVAFLSSVKSSTE